MTLLGNVIQLAGVGFSLLGALFYSMQTSGTPWLALVLIPSGVLVAGAISVRRELMVPKGMPSAPFRLIDLFQAIIGLPFTYILGRMLACEIPGFCANNDFSGAFVLIALVPFWFLISLVAVPLRVPALIRLGGKGVPGLVLYALFALIPALAIVSALLS